MKTLHKRLVTRQTHKLKSTLFSKSMLLMLLLALAACSTETPTVEPPIQPNPQVSIDGLVTGNTGALQFEGKRLTVPASANISLRGQAASAEVIRPGVRVRGTATTSDDAVTVVAAVVSYPNAAQGVVTDVDLNANTLTVSEGGRSVTMSLTEGTLVTGSKPSDLAEAVTLGRHVTVFGYTNNEADDTMVVLEIWTAANDPDDLAPDTPSNPGSGDNGGGEGGQDSGDRAMGYFVLPIASLDQANNTLVVVEDDGSEITVRILADTIFESETGVSDATSFWQAASEGELLTLEGTFNEEVIEATYIALMPPLVVQPVEPFIGIDGFIKNLDKDARSFSLDDFQITTNEETFYFSEFEPDGEVVGSDPRAAAIWEDLNDGDMVFVEGWHDPDSNSLVASFVYVIGYEPPPVITYVGNVLEQDNAARTLVLGVIQFDATYRVVVSDNTSYSEGSFAPEPDPINEDDPDGTSFPYMPFERELSAEEFWQNLALDDIITVIGGEDTDGTIVAEQIIAMSDTPLVSLSGSIALLDQATQQVRLEGVDVVLQLSNNTEVAEIAYTIANDTTPLEEFWQNASVGRMIVAEGTVANGVMDVLYLSLLPVGPPPPSDIIEGTVSDLDSAGRVFNLLEAPEYSFRFTADTRYALEDQAVSPEEFWSGLAEGDFVIVEGELDPNFTAELTMTVQTIIQTGDAPPPPPPPLDAIEGTVSDLDAAGRVFNLLEAPEYGFRFTADTRYALEDQAVSPEEFWSGLAEGDFVIIEGTLEPDANGLFTMTVLLIIQTSDAPPPPPPGLSLEGTVRVLNPETDSLRLVEAPELEIVIPESVLYIPEDIFYIDGPDGIPVDVDDPSNPLLLPPEPPEGYNNFWRDIRVGDSIFVEGEREGDRLIVQYVTRFARNQPERVGSRVLDLDVDARTFAFTDIPEWLVTVSETTRYFDSNGSTLLPEAFWAQVREQSSVLVEGELTGTTLAATSITLEPSTTQFISIEGRISEFDAGSQRLVVADRPEYVVAGSADTEYIIDPVGPVDAETFWQNLEPRTFVIVEGVLDGNVIRADAISSVRDTTSEGEAYVDTVSANVHPDGWIEVFIEGELADPCTQLGRIEQNFDGATFEVTVYTVTDILVPCEDVTVPFEYTFRLNTLPEPGNYTINVNGATTTVTVEEGDGGDGREDISPAFVESVTASILDTGRDVALDVRGLLSDPCHELAGYEVTVSQQPGIADNPVGAIDVTLWQRRNIAEDTGCADVTVPFETTLNLELLPLAPGLYNVSVNDASTTLFVDSPELGLVEANVQNVDIAVLESFPVQVVATASGFLPDACHYIAKSDVNYTDGTFNITTWQAPSLATVVCPPISEGFDTPIELDVLGLPAGDYNVVINGVEASFNLAVDNVAATP
ncbi:MAG: DUF5666 domain-containing protein [Deinococcota bacterium]